MAPPDFSSGWNQDNCIEEAIFCGSLRSSTYNRRYRINDILYTYNRSYRINDISARERLISLGKLKAVFAYEVPRNFKKRKKSCFCLSYSFGDEKRERKLQKVSTNPNRIKLYFTSSVFTLTLFFFFLEDQRTSIHAAIRCVSLDSPSFIISILK